jgi:hypothetical protein
METDYFDMDSKKKKDYYLFRYLFLSWINIIIIKMYVNNPHMWAE